MKVSDFDYDLPEDRIAQEPAARRDASRLLVLPSGEDAPRHLRFRDLPGLLRPGDLLVLNDSRVVPCRLAGRKSTGGRAEILLLERIERSGSDRGTWRALVSASRTPRPGTEIEIAAGFRATLRARVEEVWTVELVDEAGDVEAGIERVGTMPLPPYIRRGPTDPRRSTDAERYQTVYARPAGSAAAPTAGLHFTHELLDDVRRRGVDIAFVTLHVGLGTFLPVRAERTEEHTMHDEAFEIGGDAAASMAEARRRGGRVIAVGTTVVRALEARAADDGGVHAGAGRCDLFIVPGHRFRVVDAVVTNFHLPRSTLLMLVCAFGGRERVLRAYREAVGSGYRFYSYGDAMFVEKPCSPSR